MSTLIRWDPFRVQWNPLKERDELENRLSTLLGHRASTGNGGKEALTVASGRRWWTSWKMRMNTASRRSCRP